MTALTRKTKHSATHRLIGWKSTCFRKEATRAAGTPPSDQTDLPSTTPAPKRFSLGKPCCLTRSMVLEATADPGTPKKSREMACTGNLQSSKKSKTALIKHKTKDCINQAKIRRHPCHPAKMEEAATHRAASPCVSAHCTMVATQLTAAIACVSAHCLKACYCSKNDMAAMLGAVLLA